MEKRATKNRRTGAEVRLKNSQHIIAVENPLFLEELQMLAQQKNIANAIQKLSRDALDLCFCYCVP